MQNSDEKKIVARNKVNTRDYLPSEKKKASTTAANDEQAMVPFTPSTGSEFAITQLPQRDTLEKQAIGDGVAAVNNITTAAFGYAGIVKYSNALERAEESRARTAEKNGERELQLGLKAIKSESKKNKQEYKNNQIHETHRHEEALTTLALEEDKNQKFFEDKKEKRAIEKDANAIERERLALEKQKFEFEKQKQASSTVDHMVRKNGPAMFAEKGSASDQEDTLESSSEKGVCVIC